MQFTLHTVNSHGFLDAYILGKEGIERGHMPDVVLREGGCLGRAVRNKSNQLLQPLFWFRFDTKTETQTLPICTFWFVTPLYTLLDIRVGKKGSFWI